MSKVLFSLNEKLEHADLNAIGDIVEKTVWDEALTYLLGGADGIVSGLVVSLAGGTGFSVSAGMGVASVPSGTFTATKTPCILRQQVSGVNALNTSPNIRYDLVVCAPNVVEDTPSARKVLSGGALVPTSVNTRVLRGATISTVQGVAGGGIPTTPAGSILLATLQNAALSGGLSIFSTPPSIGVSAIAPDAVTSAEIAVNAVTSAEIAANAVTSAEIAANAVTTSAIATGAVTPVTIAANAVGSAALSFESRTYDLAVGPQTGTVNTSRRVIRLYGWKDLDGVPVSGVRYFHVEVFADPSIGGASLDVEIDNAAPTVGVAISNNAGGGVSSAIFKSASPVNPGDVFLEFKVGKVLNSTLLRKGFCKITPIPYNETPVIDGAAFSQYSAPLEMAQVSRIVPFSFSG